MKSLPFISVLIFSCFAGCESKPAVEQKSKSVTSKSKATEDKSKIPVEKSKQVDKQLNAGKQKPSCVVSYRGRGAYLAGDDYKNALAILKYIKSLEDQGKPDTVRGKIAPDLRISFDGGSNDGEFIIVYTNRPTIVLGDSSFKIDRSSFGPIQKFLDNIDWSKKGPLK